MPERLSPKTKEMIVQQRVGRTTWESHNNEQNLRQMIQGEVDELKEEVQVVMIGGEPSRVILELADVLILQTQLFDVGGTPDEETQEALDYAYDVMDTLGIDMNAPTVMKVLRNDSKYLHALTNNGIAYTPAQLFCKRFYKEAVGDYQFMNALFMMSDDLEQLYEGETPQNC